MTDIASDLADKIMALINSKPRSPAKDELVGLINESAFAVDAYAKVVAAAPMMMMTTVAMPAGNCAAVIARVVDEADLSGFRWGRVGANEPWTKIWRNTDTTP